MWWRRHAATIDILNLRTINKLLSAPRSNKYSSANDMLLCSIKSLFRNRYLTTPVTLFLTLINQYFCQISLSWTWSEYIKIANKSPQSLFVIVVRLRNINLCFKWEYIEYINWVCIWYKLREWKQKKRRVNIWKLYNEPLSTITSSQFSQSRSLHSVEWKTGQ